MVETLTALAYAHGRGILHCDVKPGNIMITTENRVKLMDFGIARSMTDSGMTRGGMALGSINYIAPELVQGEEPDARSDIYSVGATLYEVVTGEKAFQGMTDYEVMKARLEYQPPSPEVRNPNVSPDLRRAIMRAISKRREERFQTADEFLLALKRVGSLTVPLQPESAAAAVTSSATPVGVGKAGSATSSQVPSNSKRTWDEATLNRISKELGKYVGPLARVLVNRAAKTCTSVSELYDTLAEEIPSWEDRERFIENRPF
jgi:serine/threonine-protein kinase